jgi:hypothetical protein
MTDSTGLKGVLKVREGYDVMAFPDCTCVFVHGAICEDCQRHLMRMWNRPHHEDGHVMVARRQVKQWQDLEDAAVDFWTCQHGDEICDCSVPLGWQVVAIQLERGEIQSTDEVMRHAV